MTVYPSDRVPAAMDGQMVAQVPHRVRARAALAATVQPSSASAERARCPSVESPSSAWLPTHVEVAEADPLFAYLRGVGQTPLLKAEQEVALAQRIAAGRVAEAQLRDLASDDPMQRLALERQVADAQTARHVLTTANLRLVVSIAKKYMGHGLPLLDLIQEGNIGLMRAVEKFDSHKGTRFSTYATWWVRQGITRAIADQSRLIRIPVHLAEKLGLVRAAAARLYQELEREPTPAEIAAHLHLPVAKVELALRMFRSPLSLDEPIDNSEPDMTLGMAVADGAPLLEDVAEQGLLRETLKQALGQLDERERQILMLRHGLNDGRRRTLEEIGAEFGITRERIRQLEVIALDKMRHLLGR